MTWDGVGYPGRGDRGRTEVTIIDHQWGRIVNEGEPWMRENQWMRENRGWGGLNCDRGAGSTLPSCGIQRLKLGFCALEHQSVWAHNSFIMLRLLPGATRSASFELLKPVPVRRFWRIALYFYSSTHSKSLAQTYPRDRVPTLKNGDWPPRPAYGHRGGFRA